MFFDKMDRTLIYPLGNVAAAWAISVLLFAVLVLG